MRLRVLLAEAANEGAVKWAGDRSVLASLRAAVEALADDGPTISDVVMSSGQVHSGALFACVPGTTADGHDYASDAAAKGAGALLCERQLDLALPQVVVPSVRQAVGPVAAAFWGHPSRDMHVVGVTGTNGKTTTCAILASVLRAQGWPTGVIGTLSGPRTTPEAPELQRELARLRANSARAVAMEVSSHSLAQGRTNGARFAAGVFTNLSQDHLDYHLDMPSYFEAKARLFTEQDTGLAVVNRGDPWGQELLALLAQYGPPVATFAPEDAKDVEAGMYWSRFTWEDRRFQLNLGGRFNLANALAAATVARHLGASWEAVAMGLSAVPTVKGRFQMVDEGQDFAVVVDFAHTPAALAQVLQAARELAKGRVIVVFGAGGGRDRSKRPMLGKAAAEGSDIIILTSDNPRHEDPMSIIEEVAAGTATGTGTVLVEEQRPQAIGKAMSLAGPGDVVVLAGKGHETWQDFGDHVVANDDAAVARTWLKGGAPS